MLSHVIQFELGQPFALELRPYGTLTFLCVLMSDVIKNLMTNNSEEETWSWEARDILLDTWTALLVVNVVFYAQLCIIYFGDNCIFSPSL